MRSSFRASAPVRGAAGLLLLLAAGAATAWAWPTNAGVVVAVLLVTVGLGWWVGTLASDLLRARDATESSDETRHQRQLARTRIPSVRRGDYLAAERALYRVEDRRAGRVLLEDCRSGELLDMDAEECGTLALVKRADGRSPNPRRSVR